MGESVSPCWLPHRPCDPATALSGNGSTNIRDKLSPKEVCLIHDPNHLQIGAPMALPKETCARADDELPGGSYD
ncbi:unnamed protein product [Macrosiphum euphorbiae]|uniref:Uncharacterized protein n=1 Tax=Macrosiphum euphorbiae TaxID=13131 RepID=A0AAV0X5C6_9HEMI|nr:unnamed protein product [Macrosiphum euphorbiae]